MNRRNFLAGLIAAPVVAAFNPHRAIFDLGRRLWLPEYGPWSDVDIYPVYSQWGGLAMEQMAVRHRAVLGTDQVQYEKTVGPIEQRVQDLLAHSRDMRIPLRCPNA